MPGRFFLTLFLCLSCGLLLPAATCHAGSPLGATPAPTAVPRPTLPPPTTHEEVVDRVIACLDRMVTALLSINDAATAQTAVDQLDAISAEMRGLAISSKNLGKPTKEQGEALQAKMASNAESLKQRLRVFPILLQKAGPGAATIVGAGMKSFTEAMQEVGKMFNNAD